MLKTVEYTILRTKTRKGMKEKVEEFTKEGYECQGGIATEIEEDTKYYLQAVILRKQE